MPTAFCSRIMPLGTNVTWTKLKILGSGRFWFLLLFCHNSRSKVNFKVKCNFLPNKPTNKCNTSISCDFYWKVHFGCYFNDSRSSSRSKVNFKVKLMKMSFLTNTIRNKRNKSFWCDFDYGIYLWYYDGNSRSSSRSKGQLQGQSCEKNIFNKYK